MFHLPTATALLSLTYSYTYFMSDSISRTRNFNSHVYHTILLSQQTLLLYYFYLEFDFL